MRPGLTGWAQVNGRNKTSWSKRLAQDAWYVENESVRLDLYILIKTFWKVTLSKDVNYTDGISMPRFDEVKSDD